MIITTRQDVDYFKTLKTHPFGSAGKNSIKFVCSRQPSEMNMFRSLRLVMIEICIHFNIIEVANKICLTECYYC